jgi:hypothetical protein
MDETKLTITLKNKQPVELADLTLGLFALADEYRRFVPRHPVARTQADRDCRLYIKEVRSGSIEIDLVAMAPLALPFIENANSVVEFARYLKDAYEFLAGRSDQPPDPAPDKANYENLSKVVSVVAKDRGAQVNFVADTITFHLSSTDARAIREGASQEISALRIPVAGLHEKVVLHWYQARNTTESTAGDRAVIESLGRMPVKTVFRSEELKCRFLLEEENPFKRAYVVDVIAECVDDRPVLYNILRLIDTIDL